jgi:hypothetical protein
LIWVHKNLNDTNRSFALRVLVGTNQGKLGKSKCTWQGRAFTNLWRLGSRTDDLIKDEDKDDDGLHFLSSLASLEEGTTSRRHFTTMILGRIDGAVGRQRWLELARTFVLGPYFGCRPIPPETNGLPPDPPDSSLDLIMGHPTWLDPTNTTSGYGPQFLTHNNLWARYGLEKTQPNSKKTDPTRQTRWHGPTRLDTRHGKWRNQTMLANGMTSRDETKHAADPETCVALHAALSLRSTTVWSKLRSSIVKTIGNGAGEDISKTHLYVRKIQTIIHILPTLELITYTRVYL